MAVGTRAFKRVGDRQRRKDVKALFNKALSAGAEVEKGIKRAVNSCPFWMRVVIAVKVVMGVWK